MLEESRPAGPEFDMLIDLDGRNNLGGGGGGGPAPPMGFVGFPQPPALPVLPQPPAHAPFNYPGNSSDGAGGGYQSPPFNYNIPAYPPLDQEKNDFDTHFQLVCKYTLHVFILYFGIL